MNNIIEGINMFLCIDSKHVYGLSKCKISLFCYLFSRDAGTPLYRVVLTTKKKVTMNGTDSKTKNSHKLSLCKMYIEDVVNCFVLCFLASHLCSPLTHGHNFCNIPQPQDVCAPCKARPAPQCVRVDQQQSPAVGQSTARAKRLQRDSAGGEVTP